MDIKSGERCGDGIMKKIEFHKDGKYEEYEEINGVREGKAAYYWSADKHEEIREEFIYENGIKNGKAVVYFNKNKTNKIKEEFTYVNGVKQGESLLLCSDCLEKRYYINGKLEGEGLEYRLDGKINRNSYVNGEKEINFKSLKEILGMCKPKERENKADDEIFKLQAKKIFSETAYFYTKAEKENKGKENKLPFLFIEKNYLKYKSEKFDK